MKLVNLILLILFTLSLTSCRECTFIDDLGNPDRYIRLFDEQGNNLWFGANAIYDPNQVKFIHESEGELDVVVQNNSQSVVIMFPVTKNQPEDINMQLDSLTSEVLTYNTLVYTDDQCTRKYDLSYVQVNGERVCGSCGDTGFNDDRYINIEL